MISLKLYPREFRDLIGYMRSATLGQQYVPLSLQQVGTIVMIDYLNRLSMSRITSWSNRTAWKHYSLNLSVAVALAVYRSMQTTALTDHQQLLLNKLDQAIVNYQNPHGEPHLIGELFHL